MKIFHLFVMLSLALSPWVTTSVSAQTIAQDIVIDDHLPVGEPLEKAIDYFTGSGFPSVVVGNLRGGLYLYRSVSGQLQGPWQRSVIVQQGSAYERARPIKFNGDAYPDLVASIGNKIVLFENPGNRGRPAAVSRPWPSHVVNPNHGCHDIRIEDLDGDGKVDIVCSGAISLRAPEFVAFQNDRTHWQVVDDVADVGDDIAILRVGNDTMPHLVGSDPSGNIFWYENPRSRGGNARSAHWSKHFIGPGNVGN
ncbi:MAG TPA: VCBS repeat-containing protein, partial [Steroidobacteraceae bacterium]